MKNIFVILSFLSMLSFFASINLVFAHSGGTDSKGYHKTGDYNCHRAK